MLHYPYYLENEISNFLVELQDPITGGWPPTSPQEKISSVWTTSVVLISLRNTNAQIKFPQKAVTFILKNERSTCGCWSELKFKNPVINVCATSEAIRALIKFYKLEEIKEPLKRLQEIQNKEDHGWGITENSKSKIRTTLYVLRTLLECYTIEELKTVISKDKIQKSIFYIEQGINNENGLGKDPRTQPSDVSCTALGIIVLILAKQHGFEVHNEKLTSIIERLIHLRLSETWFPSHEEVNVDGVPISIGDCGTPLVLLVFSLATNILQYPVTFLPFATALNEITDCTENGTYKCPGINEARVWETAELLDSLQYYKKIILKTGFGEYKNYFEKITALPTKKGGHFVPLEDNNLSLLREISIKEKGLIEGLLTTRTGDKDWPASDLNDKNSEIWTSAGVLNSLLRRNIIPKDYSVIMKKIIDNPIVAEEFVGWDSNRLPGKISTYVTAEVGLLCLNTRNFDMAQKIINTIEYCQNTEGGWGICKGDTINRVRPTTWALEFILHCLENDELKINKDRLIDGRKWLMVAQNEKNNDRGWGNLSNSYPSNVTATSRALLILLLAYEKDINVDKEIIKQGLTTLKRLGEESKWEGTIEDSQLNLEGEKKQHTVGGCGGAFALQTLCLAIRNGFLSPSDEGFLNCLTNLLGRVKKYKAFMGLWVVPSDMGGEPIIWNSEYALRAIKMVEDIWLEHIGCKYIERPIVERILSKQKYWKYSTIGIISAIGIYIAYIIKLPQNIAHVFSHLSNIEHLLVGIIITIIIEEIVRRSQLFDKIIKKLRKTKKGV
jgi:prenyltransferase beta subunit